MNTAPRKREMRPRHHAVTTKGGLVGIKAQAWSYRNLKSDDVFVELRDAKDRLLGLLNFRIRQ